MITFPNAKINLGLNIIEKRPDGYHNLETIFYPIHLEDALEVVPLKDSQQEYDLKISGTPIEGDAENNLVVKAYRLLKHDFTSGSLNKQIFMFAVPVVISNLFQLSKMNRFIKWN